MKTIAAILTALTFGFTGVAAFAADAAAPAGKPAAEKPAPKAKAKHAKKKSAKKADAAAAK